MRTTYRTLLLGALCALTLSAATATAASAHEFIVAGSPITKETPATGTGGTVRMAYLVDGTEVQIECKSSTVTNTLEFGGKSSGEYVFEGCTIPAFPRCAVPSILYKAHGNLAGGKGALTDENRRYRSNSLLETPVNRFAPSKGCFPSKAAIAARWRVLKPKQPNMKSHAKANT